MRKSIYSISLYLVALILLLSFSPLPLYANLSDATEITISDGNTTLGSFTDAIFDGALYTTDGTHIAKTINTSSEIVYTATSGKISALGLVDGNIIFTKENDFVFLYDSTQTLTLAHYLNFESTEIAITSTDSKNIAATSSGDLFVIMGAIITKFDASNNKLVLLKNLEFDGTPLNYAGGGFCANEAGTELYFTINESVYLYNLELGTITKIESAITTDITEIALDVLGNIYCLSEDTLYNITNGTALNLGNAYTHLAFDFSSGKIFATTTTKCYSLTDTTGFLTNYNDQTAPVNIKNYAASNSVIDIVCVNGNSKLYSFKSLTTAIFEYDAPKNLVLLDESDANFYFVLDTAFNESYKLGYVLKSDCSAPLVSTSPAATQLKVIVANAKLYTLPNSNMIDNDTYAPILKKVERGTILTAIASPTLPTDSNSTTFIAVSVENSGSTVICYIDSRTVIDATSDTANENVLVSNASTRATTTIYTDSTLTTEIDTLNKNTSVTILENTDGICKIQYIVDGAVKTGYCKSSFINDGTLNTTQILGIVLMCVSLILAVIIAISITITNKKKSKSLI